MYLLKKKLSLILFCSLLIISLLGFSSFYAQASETKKPSSISLELSSSTVISGENNVTYSGYISPTPVVATVYLHYSTDGGDTWKNITSVMAILDGHYVSSG